MSKGITIGVISIKGGVGKTTTVANIGAALANEFNKKVLIVDANFSAPNLALHLGLVTPKITLHDVLANKAQMPEAILKHDAGFHVVPSSLIPKKKIKPTKLKSKIEYLKNYYDIILIDSSPTLNEEILATMMASDKLLVVASPDYPTLSCTMHAVRVAKKKKTPIIGLVLNKIKNKSFELSTDDIENSTNVPVLAVLPDDINILKSLAETTPSVLTAPKADSSVEYKKLAACLIGEEFSDNRIKAKLKKLFYKPAKEDLNRKEFIKRI